MKKLFGDFLTWLLKSNPDIVIAYFIACMH